ncbi:MAG: MetQ/NlpA family ABC transporter substrate-binding protein [Clostridiaceae bacterium]
MKMKKALKVVLALVLIISVFAGCSNGKSASVEKGTKIKVGASVTPHAEILGVAKDILAKQGVELEIVEFTDYVQPNTGVENGDLDANYFQHKPYLDEFNKDNNTHLVSVAAIHYEPFGIYAGKTASIDKLAEGAVIAVPNDGTNEARALILLQDQGLIKLKDGTGLSATILDIAENPKKLSIKELEAAQLALSLKDVDLAVINGNYAIQAGLNATTDALATEDKDSTAAQTYANILCVKAGNEKDPGILALIKALQSDEVKKFMEEKYKGAVVPIF